jgi:hypothetical protein
VPDRPLIVPSDEIGRTLFNLLVQAIKRQALVDVGDFAWLQHRYRHHIGECREGRIPATPLV